MDDAMSENSIIKPIINKYAPLIKMAVEQRRYIDIGNYYRDYNQEIRDVSHCENELLAYLKSNLESSEWDRESLWFIAIYEHPSKEFIPYFIKILKSKLSKSVIYYHVLDVLSYMPDEISEMALPEMYLMVYEINPYWTREIIEKYFEAIIMINSSEPMDILLRAVKSDNLTFSFYAEYWIQRLIEEPEDPET